MRFQRVDRIPLLHMGVWRETTERWQKEGMLSEAQEFAGFDGPMQSCWLYDRFQGPLPAFEEKIVGESELYNDRQNYFGQIERVFKDHTSMPAFLKYPIASREDWKAYRQRLDPDSPARYPDDWQRLVQNRQTIESGEIRGLAVWGFYGFPRQVCGPEALSYLFYDDPELIAEMNEYWLHYTIRRLARAVKEMDFDYALIWEDNCYNHGMLHSPEVFRRFMAPHYRKLIDFFRKSGIEIISVDSDGNILELIPLLLDVGVTAIHPFEVAAGMDVVEIGRQYPGLQIWGGLDKRALAGSSKTIDAELERVIPPMKERGGYAAGIDHAVPPDVSLENFRHFVKRLTAMSVV